MEHLSYKPEHAAVTLLAGHGDSSPEAAFAAHGQVRAVKRHGLLYSPGDAATQVYMVAQGEVKLSRCSADGRELTLDHLGPGELFGELEILADSARQCQAVARVDSELMVLERDTLLWLLETVPEFNQWLTRYTVARHSRMEERLETLLFKSANGKVAQVLLNLARDYGRPVAAGTLIDYPITHQEIGSLIATTRETVSYAFMEFRQLGLISTRQRRTIVLDRRGLEDVASY